MNKDKLVTVWEIEHQWTYLSWSARSVDNFLVFEHGNRRWSEASWPQSALTVPKAAAAQAPSALEHEATGSMLLSSELSDLDLPNSKDIAFSPFLGRWSETPKGSS